MNIDPHGRILVIRNDKLGDFMLAWPSFARVKSAYPEATVIALVPEYTQPMADLCPWIDRVICDAPETNPVTGGIKLAQVIRNESPDVSLSLFSEFRTALALWLARVPIRIAPATKIAQIFYNVRVKQRRSESAKPEFEYNLDLVQHFLDLTGNQAAPECPPPYLRIPADETEKRKARYFSDQRLTPDMQLVIIHPGTGGSAINLSLEQYAELAHRIATVCKCHFIITAGPAERDIARALFALMDDLSSSIHASSDGLAEFARFVAIADLFISGSTGPLHIAGAANVPTLAFYPHKKSATSLRWQTLNTSDSRLAYSGDEHGMQNINIEQAASDASALLDRRTRRN